ncbi:MAG TPA: hypothetical protein VIP11_11870 [Gemmatimonadaceae bacterium]
MREAATERSQPFAKPRVRRVHERSSDARSPALPTPPVSCTGDEDAVLRQLQILLDVVGAELED